MFILMIIMAIILSLYTGRSNFATFYMIIIASSLATSSIGYDESNNGLTALLSLPVTRNSYVRSKYLISLLNAFIVLVILGSLSLIMNFALTKNLNLEL